MSVVTPKLVRTTAKRTTTNDEEDGDEELDDEEEDDDSMGVSVRTSVALWVSMLMRWFYYIELRVYILCMYICIFSCFHF